MVFRRSRDGGSVDQSLVAGSLEFHPELGDWLLIGKMATLVEDSDVMGFQALGNGRVARESLNLPPKVGETERLLRRGEYDRGRSDPCRTVGSRYVLVSR